MKLTTFYLLFNATSSGVFTASASILPPTVFDADISFLNFALSIERLALSFYNSGLSRFSVDDFSADGLSPWVYGRFQQIQIHEKTHVEYLHEQIRKKGGEAGKACHYKFSYDSPSTFVAFASWLEAIGAAAYHGVTVLLDDKQFVSASGAIFAIEEQHSGWIDSAVMKMEPWSGPFPAPLNPRQISSLISPCLLSCPSENLPLPEPYPSLQIVTSLDSNGSHRESLYTPNAKPNQELGLVFELPDNSEAVSRSGEGTGTGLYAAFLTSNAGVLYVPLKSPSPTLASRYNNTVSIPTNDENVIAGPALLRVAYDSEGMVM
ncbi:hypothetical protein GYMLUDRAFT_645244 [Collybiopsis luxurians FD-317 M1]|nr:hypothetical protein GYMLUDRAFT_645244 [Collybiopsis luxurians FD-317 M1]